MYLKLRKSYANYVFDNTPRDDADNDLWHDTIDGT